MKRIVLAALLFLSLNTLSAKEDFALSKFTYDEIAKVQAFIEGNKYDEAKVVLDQLEGSTKVRKALDKAYVKFFIGYFYNLKNDSKKALGYYEEALAYNALPPEQAKNAYLNLVQLYMDQEAYQKAVLSLDKLISVSQPAKAEFFVYRANAYLGLKDYRRVIVDLDEAIKIEKEPKTNWLSTEFYCFYMLKDFHGAINVLKQLIERDPKNKNYWLQLSSLYAETKSFPQALSSLDIARIAKADLNENELMQLVSWLRYVNIPYKAALIMEDKLAQNIIKASERNLDSLGDLYYESKEFKKAIQWYEKAALLSEKGKIYFKIAQIQANERNYEEVVKNTKLSLQKADEERRGEKYFLLAKAHYELGQMHEAQKGFTEALKYPESKKTAQAWLEYLKEKERS